MISNYKGSSIWFDIARVLSLLSAVFCFLYMCAAANTFVKAWYFFVTLVCLFNFFTIPTIAADLASWDEEQ